MSGTVWKDQGDVDEQAARIEQIKAGTASQQQATEARDVELARQRKRDESGLTDRELQLEGLNKDLEITEAGFKKSIQAETQGVVSADLHNQTIEAKLRQTANIWRAFQSGHKDLALEWASKSSLVSPGQNFSDMRLDDSNQKGPDGKPIKMLTLVPKEEGKQPVQVPVPVLDRLEQQFGAQYKVVDKSLVRIDRTGKVTPLYEPDQFVPNQDSPTGTSSRRTGEPGPTRGVRPSQPRVPIAATGTGLAPPGTVQLQPGTPQAAMGVQPLAAQTPDQIDPNAPPPTRRQETHADTRVNHATAVVNKYFGISEFTGLEPKNQPKYISIVNRAGQLVRNGAPPETAANTAIAESVRAEKLQQGGVSGNPGTYTGPAPWRQ